MDWTAFWSALGGAGAALAAAVFVGKTWMERAFGLYYDRRREQDSVEIQEALRRRVALHDKQVAHLETVLEHLGSIRDTAFRAYEAAEHGWSRAMNQSFQSLYPMYRSLRELGHQGRTVLPVEGFLVIQEIQEPVRHLARMAVPDDEVLPEYAGYHESFRAEILVSAERIDSALRYLTSIARMLRGADPMPSPAGLPGRRDRVVAPEPGISAVRVQPRDE